MVNSEFWQGKRVYLTGHTGFKGSWMSIWLSEMGAIVKGYALPPPTTPSFYIEGNISSLVDSEIGDIRDLSRLQLSMSRFQPDILIHMAAQSLVRLSYHQPLETYDINIMGTVKVFEAARGCPSLKVIINVTTDKCYENQEKTEGYRENEALGGYDPYSSSKSCSELLTSAYRRSFLEDLGVGLATVRAGNVIGGGDWAEDRLLPDILSAFDKNQPVKVRNPKSTRPWQHVLEPLSGYLLLAEHLYQQPNRYAGAWNFGPSDNDVLTVEKILEFMGQYWTSLHWQLDRGNQPHEAKNLKLNISKAKTELGWQPICSIQQALSAIIGWHQAWKDKKDMLEYSRKQLHWFINESENKSV